MSDLRNLHNVEVDGKTVLLRTDYNVPLKAGKVDDDFRIRASLSTIRYLLERGCKIVIVSHLGRPDGKAVAEYSLRPVAERLTDLLRKKVMFVPEIVGKRVEEQIAKAAAGDIIMLENLRFDKREEANDTEFAKQLASFADVYVDDAFAVIHRAHASVVGVPKLLPSAAGLLVGEEVMTLTESLHNPKRPLLAVIGGAKVEGKIELIEQFIEKADALFIGGAMANTFLASQGINVADSVLEQGEIGLAKKLVAKARRKKLRMILPTDVVVARASQVSGIKEQGALRQSSGSSTRIQDPGEKLDLRGAEAITINLSDIQDGDVIADIGPQTIKMALDVIKKGGTVIWNGPLGVDEYPQFAGGTLKLAKGIIASKAFSVIGGGDTADVLDKAGLHGKFSFISTGGGASLELLAGKLLPGIEALRGGHQAPETRHQESGTRNPSTGLRVFDQEPATKGKVAKERRLIVANWKANTTLHEAIKLAEAVNAKAAKHPEAEVVLCPPSIYLTLLRHGLSSLAVRFGIQDISEFERGAHTGDVPASLAAQVASYAIVGHSERRHNHHESDNVVGRKVARALHAGLQPIICVGDRLHQRQIGHAERVVHDQLVAALEFVTAEELDQVVVAYEPVWAISSGDGHGAFAAPRDVEQMIMHIRLIVQARYGSTAAGKLRLLYGGSVNADNANAYLGLKHIHGLLVGGTSLDAYEFGKIIGLA